MATVPIYNTIVKQGPVVRARLSLNDVPFHHEKPNNFDSTTGLASHLLVPGKNRMRIEVYEANPLEPGNYVALAISKDEDPKMPTRILIEGHYPRLLAAVPEEERKLPFVAELEFDIDRDHPDPPWAAATPEDVPPEGTPSQHQAVRSVIEAFSSKDGATFVDRMGVKLEDMQRYYPPNDGINRAYLIRKYDEAFRSPWDFQPYEADKLRFEPRQGGRLVYVSRTDGRKVLSGQNLDDPLQSMQADLVFMRKGSELRVIR